MVSEFSVPVTRSQQPPWGLKQAFPPHGSVDGLGHLHATNYVLSSLVEYCLWTSFGRDLKYQPVRAMLLIPVASFCFCNGVVHRATTINTTPERKKNITTTVWHGEVPPPLMDQHLLPSHPHSTSSTELEPRDSICTFRSPWWQPIWVEITWNKSDVMSVFLNFPKAVLSSLE